MSKSLNQRERYALAGGGVILVLLLIIFGIALPYRNAMEQLDRKISSRQSQLQEVRRLQADYLALKQRSGRLKRSLAKSRSQAPLTFLEETASQVGGREKLVLMRPLPAVTQGALRIETTELKLERLTLGQAVGILREVEQAEPPMRVDRLHLKQRFDNAAQLDMSATVSAARRP